MACGAYTVAIRCAQIKRNRTSTWHYTFGFVDPRMADFCGFPSLPIAPTVEDGSDSIGGPNGDKAALSEFFVHLACLLSQDAVCARSISRSTPRSAMGSLRHRAPRAVPAAPAEDGMTLFGIPAPPEDRQLGRDGEGAAPKFCSPMSARIAPAPIICRCCRRTSSRPSRSMSRSRPTRSRSSCRAVPRCQRWRSTSSCPGLRR